MDIPILSDIIRDHRLRKKFPEVSEAIDEKHEFNVLAGLFYPYSIDREDIKQGAQPTFLNFTQVKDILETKLGNISDDLAKGIIKELGSINYVICTHAVPRNPETVDIRQEGRSLYTLKLHRREDRFYAFTAHMGEPSMILFVDYRTMDRPVAIEG